MSLSNALKLVYQESKISALLPITHLNSPSIFESQSGLVGTVLHVKGVPFEIEDPATLNYHKFVLHQAILGLDSRFIVYVTTHRKKITAQLTGTFKSNFTNALNKGYHHQFATRNLYENHFYLTLVLKGDDSNRTRSLALWVQRLSEKNHAKFAAIQREARIKTLSQIAQQLKANLSTFSVSILGENDDKLGFSELIQFLGLVVNGGQSLSYKTPAYSPPIIPTIANLFHNEVMYPQGHLGQYLSRYQLLFGDCIQFQGNSHEDCYFGAMLSLKKYPTHTVSILLANLLSLDCEFIATHTFALMPRDAALHRIAQKRTTLLSAEDKALGQIDDLANLEDRIASESLTLGAHQHTVMLLAPTKDKLNEAIVETTKRYANIGIVAVRETLGLEPAFWSQLPCNQRFIARASLISSENFVDFCPFHTMNQGFTHENFLGSAVTLLETVSKTPVYFNYHVKGSQTNPSKGHAAVFGGNNAGKTTLINFLDAQMQRFGGRSFYIDRDESSKIYVLACGNSCYTKISPTSKVLMNPLQLADTAENRAFLKSWFGTLVQIEGEHLIPSDVAEIINDCIDYAFEQLAPEYRTLSYVSQFLPINFSRWTQLRKWLKHDQTRIDGEFHWLFDNQEDALNFSFDKVGFDVTFLMDQTHPLIATPVYLYLLHRMRQCLDGRLTSFILAEAWQLFASPFWEKCLKEWLPTIRKKNGHFIFDTQSPKTIIDSPIKHIVLDNLATLIVFPNPLADRETYTEQLKLTEPEYQVIKDTPPTSRLFLYKQGNEAILCKLDLTHLSDYIRVLSGNTQTNKLLDQLIDKVGNNPDDWLPLFFERSKP